MSELTMQETFHVAVAANERYMPGALVALAGVAAFAQQNTPLHFHIFTEGVHPETMDETRGVLLRLHANSVIEQHICDEALLAGLPYWAGSRMASVRCFFPYILKEVSWCLYLDCDVLYLASVEEHFSYRDANAYAVVVQEESERCRQNECRWAKRRCGVTIPDSEYFNSGVMLFNFKKCREDKIPERIQQFFKEYPDVALPDQTAMNVVFHGHKAFAPEKFDRLQIFLDDAKLAERPVVHYVSGNPWLPKFGEVASGRFRLWHAFADAFVWEKRGESYRRCFGWRVLLGKRLLYVFLRVPVLWRALCLIGQWCGNKGITSRWRQIQIAHDCSSRAIREVLRVGNL